MKLGAKQTGFADTQRRLNNVATAAQPDVLKSALRPGAERIAEAARARVRERSGRLHDSIGVGEDLSPAQSTGHTGAAAELFVGPGSMVEAITEEFGTMHEAAHPYMRPAWDQEGEAALDDAASVMSAEVADRAGG